MSQSNDNKALEVVIDTTLNKSTSIENKNILYLGLGLLGCYVFYKNRYMLFDKMNSIYKEDIPF
jgi:hypothetical protein